MRHFPPGQRCVAALMSFVLVMVVTALAALPPFSIGADVVTNGDYLMNWQDTNLVQRIYKMSPASFDPNGYVAALYDAYTAQSASLPENSIELVEWCAWPNASFAKSDDLNSVYCVLGATTANTSTSSYVLVGYKLLTSNNTLSGLAVTLASPYQTAVAPPSPQRGMDPALYNPDTLGQYDDHAGLVTSVVRDSVAFWAIFGSLVGLVVVVAIVLAIVRCYRDKKERALNTGRVRGVMHEYHAERTTFFERVFRMDKGKSKRKGKSGRKGQRYGAEDPLDVRNKYDIAGGAGYDEDGAVANAPGSGAGSAVPTSRASTFWPGTTAASSREVRGLSRLEDDDYEMDERERAKKQH